MEHRIIYATLMLSPALFLVGTAIGVLVSRGKGKPLGFAMQVGWWFMLLGSVLCGIAFRLLFDPR